MYAGAPSRSSLCCVRLHLIAFDRAFSNPPVAELSLYVLILTLLIVLF